MPTQHIVDVSVLIQGTLDNPGVHGNHKDVIQLSRIDLTRSDTPKRRKHRSILDLSLSEAIVTECDRAGAQLKHRMMSVWAQFEAMGLLHTM